MRILLYPLFFFLLTGLAAAAPNFPALTGRVVDNAHILSSGTRQSLEQTLADYEAGTTNQLVIVTLPSLGGDSIEDYGYQLGRYWHIGQQGKNNGVLLIVASQEHKVRIEVGYGLEPVLTDAISSKIINGIIIPDFHAGKMEQGIVDGTQAILSVLGGKSLPSHTLVNQDNSSPVQTIYIFIFLVLFFLFSTRHPWITLYMMSSSRFGSSGLSGSGWGGGGFSGGGGSFGGGGASGGW